MGHLNNPTCVNNIVDSSISSSNVKIATPSSFSSTQNLTLPSFNKSNNSMLEQVKIDLQLLIEEHLRLSTFYRQRGQDVTTIVEGLLQSHRTHASSIKLPLSLKHRLYLCQLLHLVFDRSSLSYTSFPLKSTRQRTYKLPDNLLKYENLFKTPLSSRCRRHRLNICNSCLQYSDNFSTIPQWSRKKIPPKPIPSRKTAPGLIDAIPVFINTSAITYRIANDQSELDHNDSSLVKPLWYGLLLDLLTQAAIECYLCDSYSSIDTLLEIFSYGDIDPSDYHSDNSESDDEDSHFAATRADDYLLWQRTPYLDEFQIEMYKYCNKVISTYMKVPELITLHGASTNPDFPVELFQIPGRYNDVNLDNGLNIQIPDSRNLRVDANSINHVDQKKRHDSEDNEIKQFKKRKNLSS
ncbi:16644_t:CDS:2 [Cetraspora pellucida]|uniref:16644_t:CDS:1 n=1 Tax=Cetraspora pellucida TaxID=1433469 RepID=A0ACA9KZD0_9GLOM|nr:16644_t:CDS:2 [Cetraspora pellucida]